jgi:hypothetical protein
VVVVVLVVVLVVLLVVVVLGKVVTVSVLLVVVDVVMVVGFVTVVDVVVVEPVVVVVEAAHDGISSWYPRYTQFDGHSMSLTASIVSTVWLMPVGKSVPLRSTGTIIILSLTVLVSTTSATSTEYAVLSQQVL